MSTPSVTRCLVAIDSGGRVRLPLAPGKAVAAPWRLVRLARREGVVVSREGLTEVRGHRPLANLRWDDLEHVTTTRRRFLPGSRVVTYSVTPRSREWVEREGPPASHHPHGRPGEYRMRGGYLLGPEKMAALLEASRRQFSTHPG